MLVCDQERENYLFLVPSLITIYRIQKKDYSLEGKSFRFLIKNETLKMFPALLFNTSFWNKITTNVLCNLVLDTLFQKHKKKQKIYRKSSKIYNSTHEYFISLHFISMNLYFISLITLRTDFALLRSCSRCCNFFYVHFPIL